MRNTYATYPLQADSSGKLELTRRNIIGWHHLVIKSTEVKDGHASDQLVGGVTAHQDDDQ